MAHTPTLSIIIYKGCNFWPDSNNIALNHFIAVTSKALSINIREVLGKSNVVLGNPSIFYCQQASHGGVSLITTDQEQDSSKFLQGARGWESGLLQQDKELKTG